MPIQQEWLVVLEYGAGQRIFPEWLPCYSTYFINFEMSSLQMQTYSYQSNCTIDMTQYKVTELSLFLFKYETSKIF